MQILGLRREELAVDLMDFHLRGVRSKEISKIYDKKLNTYEEYKEAIGLVFDETDYKEYLDSSVYKYRKNYDILWGGIHIVFNEKVKTALEATGIICAANGLEFAEFTEYQIEMLGEDSL